MSKQSVVKVGLTMVRDYILRDRVKFKDAAIKIMWRIDDIFLTKELMEAL